MVSAGVPSAMATEIGWVSLIVGRLRQLTVSGCMRAKAVRPESIKVVRLNFRL